MPKSTSNDELHLVGERELCRDVGVYTVQHRLQLSPGQHDLPVNIIVLKYLYMNFYMNFCMNFYMNFYMKKDLAVIYHFQSLQ